MSTKTQAVELDKVVIKFAGDSGDGMQLTGTQFTDTSALLGNDLATFPDFPAEIEPLRELFLAFQASRFILEIQKLTPQEILLMY